MSVTGKAVRAGGRTGKLLLISFLCFPFFFLFLFFLSPVCSVNPAHMCRGLRVHAVGGSHSPGTRDGEAPKPVIQGETAAIFPESAPSPSGGSVWAGALGAGTPLHTHTCACGYSPTRAPRCLRGPTHALRPSGNCTERDGGEFGEAFEGGGL